MENRSYLKEIYEAFKAFNLEHYRKPVVLLMHPNDAQIFIEQFHDKYGPTAGDIKYLDLRLIRSYDIPEGKFEVH